MSMILSLRKHACSRYLKSRWKFIVINLMSFSSVIFSTLVHNNSWLIPFFCSSHI